MHVIIRKSLLTYLCQREDFPLFGKEGRGEIFQPIVHSIMRPLISRFGLPIAYHHDLTLHNGMLLICIQFWLRPDDFHEPPGAEPHARWCGEGR
jgi:hypothetical protein